MSRLLPRTAEQQAEGKRLTDLIHEAQSQFEALPKINQAIHRMEQKLSFVRGECGSDAALLEQPEYVVLRAYRELQDTVTTARQDEREACARELDAQEASAREMQKAADTEATKQRWDGVAIGCHYGAAAIRARKDEPDHVGSVNEMVGEPDATRGSDYRAD